ncbi:RNA polymerase sigma factor, sigma-70 family [Desulfitobacterium dichloroeliminans LMG P-21439]|uniref:RNA polymerase sigma factor, sigma-70 family n=1 Tax=Desulfitobacterium dichloroeliminans (strain LMG P-21439 / DCA1) TaxID=871963 RepID=L0F9N5_DESDL|nr:RNA polymerase sigma factor, sigma-70 family [Desulfitobacterium dichloroeliminans LMG P-21439]
MTSNNLILANIDDHLEAARSGNQDSLNWIIEHYEPEIRKIAYKFFLHRAEYEDLLQEGRIAIYKAINSYDSDCDIPFLHFVRMVIKRKLIDSLRAHNRQKHINLNEAFSLNNELSDNKVDSFIDFVTNDDDPETKIIALDETRLFLQELMSGFSELELKVFRCHYLIGMKQREITQHLGLNPKSLDNAIQRIRRKVTAYRERQVAG